ncbi:FAD/NAD(P)-binding oxidoreductase [Actinomycetaceae bacterium L2_0104]
MQSIGIIGTGLAGLRCAAELRAAGFTGTIYAWDAEGREPYDRPPLSKELFGDYEHPLADDGLGDLDELAVTVIPRAASTIGMDTTWRVDSICVDALVIATGASPHSNIAGAQVLYTVEDARAISAAITPGSSVHIVGAGWIGTEIASAASERGARVRVWEASEHFLNRTFHGTVDSVWGQWFDDAGVEVTFDTAYPGGECDILIQATGARPNVDFLPFGLRSPRGAIVTNIDGQVCSDNGPIAGLYAVGDCADVVREKDGWRFGGHWTQALSDAARAAAHLTGQPRPTTLDAPEVFSTQFGHEITLVGDIPAGGEPEHEETRRGWVMRWNKIDEAGEPELAALLAVDSPREISKARKALREPLRG